VAGEAALEEQLAGLVVAVMVARFHQVDRTALQILEVEQEAEVQQQAGRVMVGLAL
jgi:hypothetical protein